jgi:hypothetical protein
VTNIDGQLTCDRGTSPGPTGSYQLSCRDVVTNLSRLDASCRTMGGGYRGTTLDVTGCRSGVTNIDGFLTCDKGDAAPAGSYQLSCINVVTHGPTVSAQCRTKNGGFTATSVNFANCPPGKIDNLDGKLTCNLPPKPPTINVTRLDSGAAPYEVTGSGFQGGANVRIRVVIAIGAEGDFQNTAKPDGSLDAKINPGCVSGAVLHFSATDGRANSADLTGVLWSNTFNVTCP